jgi:hypothetical protein
VLADPEPDDVVAIHNTNHSVIVINACRINQSRPMHFLEFESWVLRVCAESLVGGTSALLNVNWQQRECVSKGLRCMRVHSLSGSRGSVLPALCSAIASSAIFSSMSCDCSKSSFHRCSDRTVFSISEAIRSWSLSGRREASSNAFLSSSVIALVQNLDQSIQSHFTVDAGDRR